METTRIYSYSLLIFSLLLGQSAYAADWTITINEGSGQVTSSQGANSVVSTFTRDVSSTGFVEQTVSSCSFSSGCPANGTKKYHQESKGFAMFSEKLLTTDNQFLVATENSSSCPPNAWTGNWILSRWPSAGFDMTSTIFPSFGRFVWTPTAGQTTTGTVDIYAYQLEGQAHLADALGISATCEGGQLTLAGGSIDRNGTARISSSQGGIYTNGDQSKIFFMQPSVAIPSAASLYGTYSGFTYDNGATQNIGYIRMVYDGTGFKGPTYTAVGAGTQGSDEWRLNDISINSPTDGFFTANLEYYSGSGGDPTNAERPAVCSAYIREVTSIFCLAQHKDDDTKPITFTLVSRTVSSVATSQTTATSDTYSYGTGGTVTETFDLAAGGNGLSDIILQSDGKLIAMGDNDSGQSYIARYDINGNLDPVFGTNGVLGETSFNLNKRMVLQSDGKLVIGAEVTVSGTDFRVARYTTRGILDTTFNGTGYNTFSFNSISKNDFLNGIAVDSNQKIVVGGYSQRATTAPGWDFVAARLTTGGTLDSTFGTGGKQFHTFLGFTEQARAMIVDQRDYVVLGGYRQTSSVSTTGDWAFMRLTTNGALDTTFGTSGRWTNQFHASAADSVQTMTLQSNYKIVAAGATGTGTQFGFLRLNTNGVLDANFGTSGVQRIVVDGSATASVPYTLAMQSDGKIVAVGYTNTGGVQKFAITRLTTRGILDTSFDSDGIYVDTLSSSTADEARSVAVQADGKLIFGMTATYAEGPVWKIQRYWP